MNRMKVNKYNEKKEMESNNTKPSSLDVLKESYEMNSWIWKLEQLKNRKKCLIFDFYWLNHQFLF